MGVGEYKLRCCQVILHADCEGEIEAWLAIPDICHKRTYCDGNFLNAENAIYYALPSNNARSYSTIFTTIKVIVLRMTFI